MGPNLELFSKVFTQITKHPETYDAASWNQCIAGWAWRIEHGEDLMPHISYCMSGTRLNHMIESAASLLGLELDDAVTLFYADEEEQLKITGLFAEERNVEAFEMIHEIQEDEREAEW